MYNHEPKNYQCPMCLISQGVENENVYTKQTDIFYKDKAITAFIASYWWPNNKGHVIIIPNKHFENIYDLHDDISNKIHTFEKLVAKALKETYGCDGVSSRQHNEPAGGQDVWHYHLHIFPRYKDDRLYLLHNRKEISQPEDRKIFAEKLIKYFNSNLSMGR